MNEHEFYMFYGLAKDVLCSTCHERITQGQRTDAKGTVYEWETIRAWIADRIRTCKVKRSKTTIRITL